MYSPTISRFPCIRFQGEGAVVHPAWRKVEPVVANDIVVKHQGQVAAIKPRVVPQFRISCMRWIAALPMYDWPEVRSDVDRSWELMRARLIANGIDAPEHLHSAQCGHATGPGGIRGGDVRSSRRTGDARSGLPSISMSCGAIRLFSSPLPVGGRWNLACRIMSRSSAKPV